MPGVTAPLGRTGVAIGDGTGTWLLVDQASAGLLATTTAAVHAGMKIPATPGGTEAIVRAGWTASLGAVPR